MLLLKIHLNYNGREKLKVENLKNTACKYSPQQQKSSVAVLIMAK